MKYFNKKNILLSLTVLVGYLSLHNAKGTATNGNGDRTGSPFAYAGAPTCASAGSCHNQSPGVFTPVTTIQVYNGITPVTSYVGGTVYTVTITVSSPNITANTRYGFQTVSVLSSNNNSTGAWLSLPPGFVSPIVNSRVYVEQSASQSANSVNLTWRAPTSGSGTVKFYASALVANNNLLATGDNAADTSLSLPEFAVCTPPTVTPSINLIHCNNGADGSINLTVTGGTTPYIFSWTGPSGYTSTAQNISGLAAGTYNVTVTGGTCSSTASVTLSNPAPIVLGTLSPITICEGNTLNLTETASGGTGTLQYSWTGPNGFTSNTLSPSIQLVPITDSGIYTLVVTDGNGCTATKTVHVTINPGIILQANATSPSCHGDINGSIALFPSGSGNQPFSYSWTGPNGFTATSSSLANLAPGTYTLIASQASGSCTQTYSATLTDPALLTAAASVTATPVCVGTPLKLTGVGTGGTGILTYRWSAPGNYFSNNQNPTVTNTANYNNSLLYTLAVTDANNCTASATVNAVVDTIPTVTATGVGALCNGSATGGVNVTATGGLPFTYAYSGPNSFTANTQNITNVPAGTYTVTVTSAAGCSTTKSATVTQPATSVTGAATSNTPYCANGTINLFGTGSGGTGAISYSWTGPNGFTSPVQSPSISSATILNSGTYILTVRDANNCSFLTTTNVQQSVQPVVATTVTNVSCFNSSTGSIISTVTGGAPPFTFAWTGPNGYTSSAQNPTNLAAGIYSVAVVGVCSGTGTTSVIVTQPAALLDSIYANNPVCAGTLLNISSAVSGGTGNYNYSWTGPNNFISTTSNPSIPAVTTAASGQYTLVVRDGNNCLKAAQYVVTVDTVPTIPLKDTSYCPGASVVLNAGNNGAAFLWNTGATTQTIEAGTAGSYHVIVTNGYGCPATKTIQVSAGSVPTVDSIHAGIIATNPGGFNFSAINAKSVSAYLWDFGDTHTAIGATPTHYYAATGTYPVKLYAANVCGVDTVSKQLIVTAVTGVQNVTGGNSTVNVYPNPTRDYVTIENNGGVTMNNIKVINMLGAKVYESSISNQQLFKMNTNAFAPGIYNLYIETSEGVVVRKLEVIK